MISFLLPAFLGLYIGVLLGFHPIIVVGAVVWALLIRATLAMVLYDDD